MKQGVGSMLRGVLALAVLVGIPAWAGFEIGNGGVTYTNANGDYYVNLGGSFAIGALPGKKTIIEDRSEQLKPHTRLSLNVLPLRGSAEEALQQLVKSSKEWIQFALGDTLGVRREKAVNSKVTRLEVLLFEEGEKFEIQLEGDPRKSRSYRSMKKSLLADIQQP